MALSALPELPTTASTPPSPCKRKTVPGAPVFVSKALSYKSDHPEIGIERDLSGHNALQSTFMFEAA